jgi:hypothetical protein
METGDHGASFKRKKNCILLLVDLCGHTQALEV